MRSRLKWDGPVNRMDGEQLMKRVDALRVEVEGDEEVRD